MERALFFSGLGGQGVQLAGRTLGRAALMEGRSILVFGTYGGEMRGGDTDVTIVIGDGPLRAGPVVDEAWAALVMHHHNWATLGPRIESDGLVLVDSSVFRGELGFGGTVVEIDASRLAVERGMRRAGSMVALGGFVAATGIVGLDSLMAAAAEVLPSYRSEFIEANRTALDLGYQTVGGIRAAANLRERAPA